MKNRKPKYMHQNWHAASFMTRKNIINNENGQIVMRANKKNHFILMTMCARMGFWVGIIDLVSGEEQNDEEWNEFFWYCPHIFLVLYLDRPIFQQNDDEPRNVLKWKVKITLHVSLFWLIWVMYDARATRCKTRFYQNCSNFLNIPPREV